MQFVSNGEREDESVRPTATAVVRRVVSRTPSFGMLFIGAAFYHCVNVRAPLTNRAVSGLIGKVKRYSGIVCNQLSKKPAVESAAGMNTKEPESADEHCLSELESSMSSVQIEQKSYEMPPREGISIAHFLTVADIERSARYYEKVFGARILSLGDGNAPAYLQLANIWMILNVGGGPTPDKPTVTLSVPDPNHINSFMNFRVADIQACYELWKSRGAEFITEPIPKYGEIRCYIRDPDGYIIEVGQSTDLKYG